MNQKFNSKHNKLMDIEEIGSLPSSIRHLAPACPHGSHFPRCPVSHWTPASIHHKQTEVAPFYEKPVPKGRAQEQNLSIQKPTRSSSELLWFLSLLLAPSGKLRTAVLASVIFLLESLPRTNPGKPEFPLTS